MNRQQFIIGNFQTPKMLFLKTLKGIQRETNDILFDYL